MAYLGTEPANAVLTSEQIADGVVSTVDLANNAVTPAKLSTGAPLWDTSGNVGIGVTPSAWSGYKVAQVANGALWGIGGVTHLSSNTYYDGSNYKYIISDYATDYYQLSGIHVWRYAASGTAGGTATFAEAMRVDASGNLLVGTASSSASRINVVPAVGSAGVKVTQAGAGDYCYQASAANNGGTHYFHYFTAGSTYVGQITSNGSTTSYTSASDYRLKENIAPMTGALNVVQKLKPVTYTWKANGSSSQGFIAHELQEVCPEAVVGAKDAVNEDGSIKPQGIDTSFLVATLTAAIQELKATVDAQAARIAALESN